MYRNALNESDKKKKKMRPIMISVCLRTYSNIFLKNAFYCLYKCFLLIIFVFSINEYCLFQ